MKINWFKIQVRFLIGEIIYTLLATNYKKEEFIKFNNYLRIGGFCKDCEEDYYACKCEKYNKIYQNINSYLILFSKQNLSKNIILSLIRTLSNRIEFNSSKLIPIDELIYYKKQLEDLL